MKRFTYIFGGFILFLLASCTEPIDLDLNKQDNQRLVVDAWITDELGEQEIYLTLTANFFDTETPPPATGALVVLTDGTTADVLEEKSPGVYVTEPDFQGVPGTNYTLTIEYDGEDYEATSYMSPVSPIDSVDYYYETEGYGPSDEIDPYYSILLYAQEPEGSGDNYLWRAYVNDVLYSDTLRDWSFASDEFVDGNYIGGFPVTDVEAEVGDKLTLEARSISTEAYEYFIAVMLETVWRGGPFDTPPANTPTNISNGALGFFNASSVSTASITIEE